MSDEALVAAIKRGQEADALRARVAALEAENKRRQAMSDHDDGWYAVASLTDELREAQAALREAQVREVVLVEALGGLVRDVFKDCACDGNGARCDFHASLTAARAALASPSDAAAQLLAELTTAREQLTVAANFGDAVARATIGKLQADEPADARAHAVRKLYEALAEMVESSPLAIKGGRLEAAIKNGLDRLRGL